MTRNLAYRESDGLTVSLDFTPESGSVTCSVQDTRTDDSFTVDCPRSAALEVFYHPFAFRPLSGSEIQ